MAAHPIEQAGLTRLFKDGSAVWAPTQPVAGFDEVEIERTGTGPYRSAEDLAFEIFQPLITALEQAGGRRESATKYQRGLAALGMAGAQPTR